MTALAVLAGLVMSAGGPPAAAADEKNGGWGTIKGQIVFEGTTIPKPAAVDVNKDQKHCLSKGAILEEKWVINAKNKGVHWTLVWLAPDPESGETTLPVHPDLKNIKDKQVVIDQPCCKFIPHFVALREGQSVLVKNSAPVTHSIKWTVRSGGGGNVTIEPNGKYNIQGLKAQKLPIELGCAFHGWMKGYMAVFTHPYFAVTDENGNFEIKNAPAGKYRLMVWHEAIGYRGGAAGRKGQEITIKAGGVTDLKKLGIKPEK
jgi:hypothetical protein